MSHIYTQPLSFIFCLELGQVPCIFDNFHDDIIEFHIAANISSD